MMKFNLTSDETTTFDAKSGWIRFNGKLKYDLEARNHFNLEKRLKECQVSLHTQLYDEHGDTIGFNQKSYDVRTHNLTF
jgi:hypothetical protein